MKKNIFYSLLLLSLFSFLLLTTFSCKDDAITPPELQPGRRDYTWTVDTLFLPFNPFTDITGTSPSDLWVCSPGDADKIFYHYNGNHWSSDLFFRNFSPFVIYSINVNNILAAGRYGKIWQYIDFEWKEQFADTIYSVYKNQELFFQSMEVSTSTTIYAVGQVIFLDSLTYQGVIYKYNQNTWGKLNIPAQRTAFVDMDIDKNGKIYLWGVSNESVGGSRYQFYELIGENLKQIYSGSQSTIAENGSLLQTDLGTYFIIGYDFFSYNGSDLQKWGRLTDNLKFRNLGIGRNKKDIFLFMTDGIMHYNGENSTYLYQTIDKSFVSKGILFDKEVFFLGRDTNGNNLIFHGKLNE